MSETQTETAKETGLFPDLSYEQYVRLPGVRASDLEMMKVTPLHARHKFLHPPESTADQERGQAFHCYLFERARFDSKYAVAPKMPEGIDRRYKEGKRLWAEFEAAFPNHIILEQKELDSYRWMADSVMSHETARELLARGKSELAMVWMDKETGLPCKGRMDHLGPYGDWTWITDLKTTDSYAREYEFQKNIKTYGYHRSMAYYRAGVEALSPGMPRRCAFIVVESKPPYATAVYELDERALEQGEREIMGSLKRWDICIREGKWPAYDQGMGLIDLPAYAVDREI